MAEVVTVNKTVTKRTFVKYKVLIERIDVVPVVKKEWGLTDKEGAGVYAYLPEYDSVSYESTDALKMEIREEIDLRNVVKALLWADPQ